MAEFNLAIGLYPAFDVAVDEGVGVVNAVSVLAEPNEEGIEFVPVWENITWLLDSTVNRSGFISGVVKYKGVVQSGIRVNLNYRKTGGLIRTTFTGVNGDFSFLCGLDATSSEYMVIAEGGVDQTSVLVDKVIPNNVNLVMELLDGTGQATTGADYTQYIASVAATGVALAAVAGSPSDITIQALAVATETEKTLRKPAFNTLLTGLDRLGSTQVSGVLKKTTYPVSREVRLYDRTSGELITSTFSDLQGQFTLTGISPGDYYVTAHDFGTIDNKAIIRNITI